MCFLQFYIRFSFCFQFSFSSVYDFHFFILLYLLKWTKCWEKKSVQIFLWIFYKDCLRKGSYNLCTKINIFIYIRVFSFNYSKIQLLISYLKNIGYTVLINIQEIFLYIFLSEELKILEWNINLNNSLVLQNINKILIYIDVDVLS